MKKLFVSIISVMIFLIFIQSICYAYSTSNYSINIPYGYKQTSIDTFANTNGNGISITMEAINSENYTFHYDNKTLNDFANSIENNLDDYKEELKKAFMQAYNPNTISYIEYERRVNVILNSIKINIPSKEITTFTKNDYKCFCIEYYMTADTITPVYGRQYVVLDKSNAYIVTMTGSTRQSLYTSEVESMLDSFTINNYRPIDDSSFESIFVMLAVIIIITLIIFFAVIKPKRQKNNEKEIIKENDESNIEDFNTANEYTIRTVYNTPPSSVENVQNDNKNLEENSDNMSELPMYWYKFFTYFRLPVGLFISVNNVIFMPILNEQIILYPLPQFAFFILTILYSIFMIYILVKRKKDGLSYISIELLIEVINMILPIMLNDYNIIVLLFVTIFYFLIWFLPNYIYFKKRKKIFTN